MIIGYWIRPARWIIGATIFLIIGLMVKSYFPSLNSMDRINYINSIRFLSNELLLQKQTRIATEKRAEQKRQARVAAEQKAVERVQARMAEEQRAAEKRAAAEQRDAEQRDEKQGTIDIEQNRIRTQQQNNQPISPLPAPTATGAG